MKIERIVCPEDCGNAPKKAQLRDLTIALFEGSVDTASALMTDGIVWDNVGSERLVGREAVIASFALMSEGKPTELHIHSIITHGKTAALNATVTMKDGTQIEYCDVYVFTGGSKLARIKEVKSYRVTLS